MLRVLLCAAAALALTVLPSRAQANDDCLMCHEEPDLAMEKNGQEISLHVDPEAFSASVHGDLECVMCHQDLAGAELPHEGGLERVDCSGCHDDVAEEQARSLHGVAAGKGDALAPTCAACHGTHAILTAGDPNAPTAIMNVPLLCGRCHHEGSPVSVTHDIPQDRILQNYSLSIHGVGLYQKGLTVTAVCTSCHTAHLILPHTDPESSIHPAKVAATCTRCHAQIEEVHRKVIEGRLWEEEPHKIPSCVDCHSPHKIRKVFYPAGMANKDCLTCHGDEGLVMERDGKEISLYVDEGAYNVTEHAGTACAQCHTEVTSSKTRACETIRSEVDCSICHAGPVGDFQAGIHGRLLAEGDPDAPTCLDCHDKHATLGKEFPASPTYARNVPELCSRCHRAGEQAAVRIEADVEDIFESYVMSIHGKGLLESGLVVTATCASCHTAHRELPPLDEASSVHSSNVAGTCGNCHHGIEEAFKKSIHWPENVETDKELPTCEDCHSSHSISRVDKGDFRFQMMDQCGRCHEDEATTFFDTFHGKVSRLGSSGAAKCYDCHGTHGILPTTDPRSTLSFRNVVDTCAQCHTGAHRRFAGYLTHATHHDADKYPFLFWSFWGMTALLVGTLTFAMLHTLAWLWRLWLTRAQWRGHGVRSGEKLYRRFGRRQRTLHLVMLVSFFTLALTGMTLKFSYMQWADVLSWMLGGFHTMAVLHRIGAIILFVIFFLHLWDVRKRKLESGRSWLGLLSSSDSIIFNKSDVGDVIGSIKWFFGLGPRPQYGRYTYWEKFDYFAVFWGIAIIGSTGLILWFPEFFTRILPGWSVNVATIIHSDEALLAVGFIFTVHFFNTHFRPDKFPMDPVIFTGRVPLEEFKYDKPREYQELVKAGRLEEHLVDPFPKPVERGFKIFGFIALAVGLTLIGLIVYAMLFGYR
jgi:cytochrome b subunit of formate dehydrogenase